MPDRDGRGEAGGGLAEGAFAEHARAFDEDPAEWNSIAEGWLRKAPRPSEEVRRAFVEAVGFVCMIRWTLKHSERLEGATMDDAQKMKDEVDALKFAMTDGLLETIE
jgi:hypothetical protein